MTEHSPDRALADRTPADIPRVAAMSRASADQAPANRSPFHLKSVK
jgi:hypothetical protein